MFVIILSALLLAGCSRESTTPVRTSTASNATVTVKDVALPSWYVFKIRQLRAVTDSTDGTFATIEGVTTQGREFRIKVVWADVFRESHRRAVDGWIKRSKAEFEAGIPYVIAGEVINRDPLTIRPDTVVANAAGFGAPPRNVY
ncbi:MAG: hypothetical protein ACHQPI_14680 [Thermoanaerobaculia bacterium]